MKKTLIVVVLALVGLTTARSQSKVASKVGVVSAKNGVICLQIANRDLKSGEDITVVFPTGIGKGINLGEIDKKLERSCAEIADDALAFYSLTVPGIEPPAAGIGVVGVDVGVNNGVASADIDGDGKKDSFRSCTSTESVHFTVWSGKQLTGRRLWHGYYYLGYDTPVTCKRAETR